MKVVCHEDLHILQEELVRRITHAKRTDPLAPVLVLAPTRRLADRLQRLLAERRDAWLSVEVLNFQSLARSILEMTGKAGPRIMGRRVLASVLQDLLLSGEFRGGRLASFTEKRPGALPALLSTIGELREAGIDPSDIVDACPHEHELAAVYRSYVSTLDRLRVTRGLTDRAGFLEEAVPPAGLFGERFRAIFLHGAYELIGMHLDLLRALDSNERVTVLLPASPREEAPAYSFAHRFAKMHLLPEGCDPEPLKSAGEGGLFGDRLEALYDENASIDPLTGENIEVRNFQGGAAEVEWAVRMALLAVAEGVSPHQIGIVARTLEPYSAHLEAAFDEAGIPWTTSTQSPLRREPVVHDILVLLDVLRNDFPRAATTELLGSPRVRWDRVQPSIPAPPGDLAESWSRSAGILGGLDEWTNTLPEWASSVRWSEERTEDERALFETYHAWKKQKANEIAGAVQAIAERCGGGATGRWSEHADRIEMIVSDYFRPDGDQEESAIGVVLGLLDEMRTLDEIFGDGKVPTAKAYRWFEMAVDETGIDRHGADNGGIRVLDAMQGRGLTFRRLFLIGFHGGLLPRIPREDPFLRDDLRKLLRKKTGRPLPVKLEGEDEEHLLLSMMLGGGGEEVHISWQRADDEGRAMAPSMALREVARLVLGNPDFRTLVGEIAKRTPAHPLMRLETILTDTGLLSAAEERLLIALRGGGSVPAVWDRLIDLSPDLEYGLSMLAETERFDPASGRFDGRIGDAVRMPDSLSVSGFEQLGRCPLKFFFQKVLNVRALDEEISPFGTAPFEFGTAVHGVLEDLYRQLWDERLPGCGDAAKARHRAREVLDEIWKRRTAGIGRRVGTRFSALWRIHEEQWLDSLRAFLDDDLDHLAGIDLDGMEFEDEVSGSLDLGEGISIGITGRFDRVSRIGDRIVIADYKTSGKLGTRCDVTQMLKGTVLQVPLYALLAASNSNLQPFDEKITVQLLGVGPAYDPEDGENETRPFLNGLKDGERAGILETLRILKTLSDNGIFPLLGGDHCSWCAFKPACRRSHAPTLNREEYYSDAREFRRLSMKNKTRQPLLADITDDND